ncbi:hypothetical protein N7517_006720 [Penicillium concentricum]|uniref:Uncharacterized protein n=1 Tax=Penicillium concentricum TaxID=293559 RepID=A0A9W9SBW7_9EURO|nr:uncharacterized protein N7517_006720 [Penicillium concentricum]KAJ5374714.1 hypothetical protein N7517_006720 [Penicillium concentricum]
MSSKAAGIVIAPGADIRCVVCSKLPAGRLRELVLLSPRIKGSLGHSTVSFITTAWEEIVTDPQTDRPPDLLSVRPNQNTRKEAPIRHGGKSEEETVPPKLVRFAAQTIDDQNKSSPVKHPNEDPSQVGRGSGIRTTGRKYYLMNLTVSPNSPGKGSAEMTPKGKTRVDVMDERNWKPPVERPYVAQEAKEIWRV